jgi:hypothetical protein
MQAMNTEHLFIHNWHTAVTAMNTCTQNSVLFPINRKHDFFSAGV